MSDPPTESGTTVPVGCAVQFGAGRNETLSRFYKRGCSFQNQTLSERTGPPVGGRQHSPTRSRAGRAAGAGGARDDRTDDDETLQAVTAMPVSLSLRVMA